MICTYQPSLQFYGDGEDEGSSSSKKNKSKKNRQTADCVCIRAQGLISPSAVLSVLQKVRETVSSRQLPWASVTVWGFADSPVSWGEHEHSVSMLSGENDYTFLILPDGTHYCQLVALGPQDTYS